MSKSGTYFVELKVNEETGQVLTEKWRKVTARSQQYYAPHRPAESVYDIENGNITMAAFNNEDGESLSTYTIDPKTNLITGIRQAEGNGRYKKYDPKKPEILFDINNPYKI